MWVWSEDHTAMVNLDHCFLMIVRESDVGFGVTVHKDRGDMGTLLKVVDTKEEAESFVNSLGAASNANGVSPPFTTRR